MEDSDYYKALQKSIWKDDVEPQILALSNAKKESRDEAGRKAREAWEALRQMFQGGCIENQMEQLKICDAPSNADVKPGLRQTSNRRSIFADVVDEELVVGGRRRKIFSNKVRS